MDLYFYFIGFGEIVGHDEKSDKPFPISYFTALLGIPALDRLAARQRFLASLASRFRR